MKLFEPVPPADQTLQRLATGIEALRDFNPPGISDEKGAEIDALFDQMVVQAKATPARTFAGAIAKARIAVATTERHNGKPHLEGDFYGTWADAMQEFVRLAGGAT